MHFSLTLYGLEPGSYASMTQRAEELGFEIAWLADHLIIPLQIESRYPYSASGRPSFTPDIPLSDIWVNMGHLAALTRRIKLGSAVYVLPLRNPFVSARAIATAQNLSNGRVILAVGSGWCKEEFDVVGEQFSSRGARTDEILDILAKLWSGEPVDHQGKYYQFPKVQFGAPPAHPVPLVFGGHSPPVLRRAALRGDGWYGGTQTLEEVTGIKKTIDAARAAANRSHLPFTYYVRLSPPVTADRIRAYEDAGFEHVVFAVRGPSASIAIPSLGSRLEGIDEVANDVVRAGYRLG